MKFLHLSDLHIGLKLYHYDLYEDQKYIFDQISDYIKKEKPDAIVIAGDIYDKAVPSAEAVELFDYFMNQITDAAPEASIMIISGNHDSAGRVNVFRNVLSKRNIYMIGNPPYSPEEHIEKVVLTDEYGPVNFYLLPFVKPTMVKQIVGTDTNGNNFSYNDTIHKLVEREDIDTSERNIFVSHQFYLPKGKNTEDIERMDSEIVTVGNIDQVSADILEVFDYAALGHIHKPMQVGKEVIRYAGTPLACSVSEAEQEKGIIVVEIGAKNDIQIHTLSLKPKYNVRIVEGEYKEVLNQSSEDYVSVVLTDDKDLDVIDMQDRIRHAFPHLLEIRRKNQRRIDYKRHASSEKEMDPYELCMAMIKDVSDEEEMEILKDVINTVKGGK